MSTKNEAKYLIVESPVHNQLVLLAATHLSSNEKTGGMTQIWILHPDDTPLSISKQGKDDRICGGCPLRHSLGGACYVVLFMGPNGVYKGWENGGKRVDSPEDFIASCQSRRIRFGAYGDPAHIPAWLAAELMGVAYGWTAYTHQWRNPVVASTWKGNAMASCDTVAQARQAEDQGWAAFLATPETTLDGIALCNNEEDGTQCISCLKCNGRQGSVRITPHGQLAGRHPSMKNVNNS